MAELLAEQVELVRVPQIQGHQSGEEFDRMVGLKVSGLVGDQGIGRGVGLVEAVARELVDLIEDPGGRRLRNVARHGAVDEGLALGRHFRLDLLAHGPAQEVGGGQAEAREDLGDLHHLLLIDHDPGGLLENALERGVQIVGLLLAVPAGDVARDVVHRPRAVEGDQGDDVLEPVGPELFQHVPHARALQLEHAGGFAAPEHLVGRPVVERKGCKVDADAAPFQQHLGAGQNGQGLEPQEIELHQPGLLHILHVELGDRHVGARVAVERDQLVERAVADHHAGGVGRGVAVQALELEGDVDEPRHRLLCPAHLLQHGLAVDGLLQADRVGRIIGHQLANAVDLAVGHFQHPADVAEHGAGLELAEGDDLGHPVAAVPVLNVGDDLVAQVLAEVDIEIRHRYPLGVEEALEQKAEAERVQVRDSQRPGGHRARPGAPARTDGDGLGLGPLDDVGDDQEIARQPHLDDDIELVVETLPVRLDRPLARGLIHVGCEDLGREPGLEALLCLEPQLRGLVAPAFHGKGRQDGLAGLEHVGAALGDDQGVVHSLGQVGEQGAHLGGRFEAVIRGQPAAVGLREKPALGDA